MSRPYSVGKGKDKDAEKGNSSTTTTDEPLADDGGKSDGKHTEKGKNSVPWQEKGPGKGKGGKGHGGHFCSTCGGGFCRHCGQLLSLWHEDGVASDSDAVSEGGKSKGKGKSSGKDSSSDEDVGPGSESSFRVVR